MLLERIELNHVNRVSFIWLTMVSKMPCWIKRFEFRRHVFVTLIFEGASVANAEVMVLARKMDRKRMHIKEIFVPHRGPLIKTGSSQYF